MEDRHEGDEQGGEHLQTEIEHAVDRQGALARLRQGQSGDDRIDPLEVVDQPSCCLTAS